jgi:hypothetical protein
MANSSQKIIAVCKDLKPILAKGKRKKEKAASDNRRQRTHAKVGYRRD